MNGKTVVALIHDPIEATDASSIWERARRHALRDDCPEALRPKMEKLAEAAFYVAQETSPAFRRMWEDDDSDPDQEIAWENAEAIDSSEDR